MPSKCYYSRRYYSSSVRDSVRMYASQLVVPSAPPANIHATMVDNTTMYLTWEPPPAHSLNGRLLGYKVLTFSTFIMSCSVTSDVADFNQLTFSAPSLAPCSCEGGGQRLPGRATNDENYKKQQEQSKYRMKSVAGAASSINVIDPYLLLTSPCH